MDIGGHSGISEWERLLSEDEHLRAGRCSDEDVRARYVISRGVLRILLGGYLNEKAHRIHFVYNPRGKPGLPGLDPNRVQFNLSHAGSAVIFGFTRMGRIGVDLEMMTRETGHLEDFARRFFSTEEYEAFLGLPEDLRRLGFFNCWTRKEAYVKAIGEGLTMPLNRFAVALRPDEPAKLMWVSGQPGESERWTMIDANPAIPYIGAVAVEGLACSILRRRFSLVQGRGKKETPSVAGDLPNLQR